MEKVSFMTKDGVQIVGSFFSGEIAGPSALLLHMMPATKESWDDFAEKLVAVGFENVLAIDLRGHGESTIGERGTHFDYQLFEDEDHMASLADVEAARKWLQDERGVTVSDLAVVGASIGANLAIVFGAHHHEIPAVVALSPGLDYRGVTTDDKVVLFDEAQSLYLASSEEDTLSFQASRRLAQLFPSAVVMEFSGAGHGTTMFEREPSFMSNLASWLGEVMHKSIDKEEV